MKDKKICGVQGEVGKALAYPLRIEVIDLLRNGELCFSDILGETGGIKSNLSQHIAIMTGSGILKVRKESQCNYYSLSSPKVAKACAIMREVLMEILKKQQQLHKELLK